MSRSYEYDQEENPILFWILYGNIVDFSFIVSLYVSDLPNVTIGTSTSMMQICRVPYRKFACTRSI